MTPSNRIWIAAAGLAACLAGAACGASDTRLNPAAPAAPIPSLPSVPPGDLAIDVAEINGPFSFYPNPSMAGVGQLIVWRNTDVVAHHIVFDDTTVDTGTLAPGTLSQPVTVGQGTWNYHCSIHPEMVGRVIVADTTKQIVAAAPVK